MRYGLAVIAFIVVAFLAIVFVVNRSPSGSGNDSPTTRPTTLMDYKDKNAILSVTTQGRMVGQDQRRAIRISVTPTERRLEVLGGYEQDVLRSQSYTNTREAYEAFVVALNRAGFMRSQKTTINNHLSACPLGQHYIYDVSEGGQHRSNLWSVSCSNVKGTFSGNGPLIRQLFQLQIPEYKRQVSGVRLH